MKNTILILSVLLCGSIFQTTNGQIPVNVSVNIGQQPSWGPVGYDHVDYYYLPDIDTYYYVPKRQYIYLDRGKWRYATVVPARYRSFDFNLGYKVVINEPYPYRRADVYRIKYKGFKGNHGQKIIGGNRSSKNIFKQKGNSGNGNRKVKGKGKDKGGKH